jgi:hypothetical protein
MRQTAFIVATLTGSLLFGASVSGALRAPASVGIPGSSDLGAAVQAQARDTGARAQAALVAAIEDQFPGHTVDVALQAPVIDDDGASQQQLQALARVRIDGSAPMLVRANALFDRATRSIDEPSLWFEGTGEHPVSDATRRGLAAAATQRLDAEFAGQPVTLALADAEGVAVGGRYLRVVARGTADFGAEGRAAATVEALYDPQSGEWLRLDYALGADPAQTGEDVAYAGT